VCLLGVGKLVSACEDAARILAGQGIDATVWDVRVVSPLDPAMVDDALAHRLVVSIEDGVVDGGVGSLVESALRRGVLAGTGSVAGLTGARPAGLDPAGSGPTVVNCGVPTAYLPHGRAADILARLGLDGPGISRTVLDHV